MILKLFELVAAAKSARSRTSGRNPRRTAAGDGVVGVARQAEAIEMSPNRIGGPRRVGHQHHVPPLTAPLKQPFLRTGEQSRAVMHHAPDIAEDQAIFGRKLVK